MLVGFARDRGGVSTPQLALLVSGLAVASLIGVRVLEAPLASRAQASFTAETQTDLERLARTIPAAKGRVGGAALPAAGQIDFTATANNSGKRSLQSACHGGRTVSMVAPAGGPPMVLSTCAQGKTWRD